MSFVIEDGRGKGRTAMVNEENRLATSAETNVTAHFVSLRDQKSFNVFSHDATAAAGTHPIYLKNDSDTDLLFIDLIRVGGVATILWKVWSVTGTAAGGNALTPPNLNLTSSVSADVTARGDDAITGLTQDTELATIRSAANNSITIPFDDILVLGKGNAIAVEADTVGSTSVAEILIRFYMKDKVLSLAE